jgi:hypothetical protein
MITIDSLWWREKVTPALLEIYDTALAIGDSASYRVVLAYNGSYNNLHLDAEVLSAIDDRLQIVVPLSDLPLLASKPEINTISLPVYALVK